MLPLLLLPFLSILHTGAHRPRGRKHFRGCSRHLQPSYHPPLSSHPSPPWFPRSVSTRAAFQGVSNANRGVSVFPSGHPHFSRTSGTLAEARSPRKWVGQTPCTAETWKAMVDEDRTEMPGNWVRPIPSHEGGKLLLLLLFFFGAPDINTLRSSWPRGIVRSWWLLPLKAVRLSYLAK